MKDEFFLWYDNGTGYFDCASKHRSLSDAVAAAHRGWQPRQHITTDAGGCDVVWKNY